jgi:hypothetical protein
MVFNDEYDDFRKSRSYLNTLIENMNDYTALEVKIFLFKYIWIKEDDKIYYEKKIDDSSKLYIIFKDAGDHMNVVLRYKSEIIYSYNTIVKDKEIILLDIFSKIYFLPTDNPYYNDAPMLNLLRWCKLDDEGNFMYVY